MLGALVKVVLVGAILVAGAFFLFGYWTGGTGGSLTDSTPSTADAPSPSIDTAAARERGAELGERAAKVVATAGAAIDEGTLTAKIKAKMVLDDLVKARAIDVTTTGSVVILTGTVHSRAEQERAVSLAKETEGVTQVTDRLVVRQP